MWEGGREGLKRLSVAFVCELEGKAACAKMHVAPLHIGGTGLGLQASLRGALQLQE